MNALSNYDMLARSLKDDQVNYIDNYKQAQEAKNAETALTYESISAPFIEQGAMGLLQKGFKYGGKQLGFSDEQLDNFSDIGERLKSGDVASAIDGIRNMRTSKLISPEQEGFLNDQLGKFNKLKEGVTELPKRLTSFKTGNEPLRTGSISADDFSLPSVTKQLDKEVPRVSAPTANYSAPTSDADLISLPKIELTDAGTGQTITRPKPSMKPQPNNQVLDEDGNPLQDENARLRNKLEFADVTDSTEAEIAQNKRELGKLIGRTEAPEEVNTFQSAMDFLSGKKGSASAKWGRKPAEMDDISNFRPTNEPLINPRDVAPDIKVPERSDYFRRGNIRVSSKPTEQRPRPKVEEPPAPIEEEPPVGSRGVAPEEVDRILGQTDEEPIAGLDRPPAGVLEPKNLKARYKLLSNEGKGNYKTNLENAGDGIDQQGRSDLLKQEELADFAQKRGQYEPPEPPEPPKQDDTVEDKPSAPLEDKPPPIDDDEPSLGKTVVRAGEDVSEDIAEGGGVEDPISDLIAVASGLGILFGGLSKAHESSKPPPLLQMNPTYQLGQGQE